MRLPPMSTSRLPGSRQFYDDIKVTATMEFNIRSTGQPNWRELRLDFTGAAGFDNNMVASYMILT